MSKADDAPGADYESLPIELGPIGGRKTSIYLYTIPIGPEHAEARQRLLEEADGIVFVADLRPTRHEATLKALDELRAHLAAQGRALDDLVLIVQYNFRDLADENAVEALHRRLDLQADGVFESVASDGTGVLQTLTSLSKLIVRRIRHRAGLADSGTASGPIVAEPEAISGVGVSVESGKGLEIESAGPAETHGTEVRVPIALVEPESGRRFELSLRLTVQAT
jgi:hypothetical protein